MWFDSCSKLFAHGLMTHVICNAEYFCGNRGENYLHWLTPLSFTLCLSLSASSVLPSLPPLCLSLSASSLSFPLCLLSVSASSVLPSLPPLCLSPSLPPLCPLPPLSFPLCLLSIFPSQPPCLDVDMPMLNPVKAWTDYHYIITVLDTAEPCQGKNRLCNSNAWDKMNATSIVHCIFCVLHFFDPHQ